MSDPAREDSDGSEATSNSEPPREPSTPPEAERPTKRDETMPSAEAAVQAPSPRRKPRLTKPASGLTSQSHARMTLLATGIVFGVTLLAWGGAKAKCNLHPPRYEAFKPAPLTRLAATPKDGALEFHHRLGTLDFPGARELATSDGIAIVENATKACDAACLERKPEREADAYTRAILLRRDGRSAVAKVETHFKGEIDTATYRVEWQDRMWKVSGVEE